MLRIFSLFLLSIFFGGSVTSKIRLERVVIAYYNPEYIEKPSILTSRVKRGETYKTNATVTIMQEFNNNVTSMIYFKKTRNNGEHYFIRAKVCDFLRHQWWSTMLKKYTDIPVVCPYPAHTYNVINLELTPKLFPFKLPQGENFIGLKLVRTMDEMVLIDFLGTLQID